MKIDINGVSITLTKEQLSEIAKQTSKQITADSITYESAKKLLEDNNIDPDPNILYRRDMLKLITIIKAINFIDNGNKEWIIDFDNRNQTKYYPWFEKKSSGWLLYTVGVSSYSSDVPAGLFYCKRNTAKIISKRYLNTLYKTYLG